MTTPEMTTPPGGGQGKVVRRNTLKNQRNDHLTTSTPHTSIIPTYTCVGGYRGGGEVGSAAPSWPHGTGGRCGAVFAATLARRQADIARLGLRAATELWIAEGTQGSAIMAVLTEADWARMERAR